MRFFEKLYGFASGYKTYIVAAIAILSSLASLATGDMEPAQAFQVCVDALLGATIRAGIKKGTGR